MFGQNLLFLNSPSRSPRPWNENVVSVHPPAMSPSRPVVTQSSGLLDGNVTLELETWRMVGGVFVHWDPDFPQGFIWKPRKKVEMEMKIIAVHTAPTEVDHPYWSLPLSNNGGMSALQPGPHSLVR